MIYKLDDSFSALNEYIRSANPSKIFILVDENTHTHCLPILLGNLETTVPFELLEIEAGEEMKNIESAISLWEILLEYEADRKALFINLGGGVITDLGGFVASTFKRGIDFIHIPTTLLGMVDASVGGKTGIDFGGTKNTVGTFSYPKGVFIYTDFLKTLPQEHFLSGFAEMLKHGLITNSEHWKNLTTLQELTVEAIEDYIFPSLMIKNTIVNNDPIEKNERKLLNFGHTIGHAIESFHLAEGEPILHGFAVAMGMYMESRMSMNAGILSAEDFEVIENQLIRLYPFIQGVNYPLEILFPFMKNDKKNEHLGIGFVALEGIGKARFDWILDEDMIRKYI